jgi:hypothetical protein
MIWELLLNAMLIGVGVAVGASWSALRYIDKLEEQKRWYLGETSIAKQMEADGWHRP